MSTKGVLRLTSLRVGVAALVLAAVAVVQPANGEDRRSDPSHLILMTLNAEFMWDGFEPEEGSVNFAWKGNSTKARAHMQDVANIIQAADPDILNLVEVENELALRRLNEDFLQGLGYRVYFVQGKDYATGEDMGLLTRVDPVGDQIDREDAKGVSGLVEKSVSKNYFAKFSVGPFRFALIGAHFLAHPDMTSRINARQAQADAMRTLARKLDLEGFPPVIAGDFNDYDGADSCLDKQGSQPITTVLAQLKALDPSRSDDDLRSAAQWVAQADRYTSHWDKNHDGVVQDNELASIDHILLPRSLLDQVESVAFPHNHDPVQGPDHYPIVVTLSATPGGPVPPAGAPIVRIVAALPNPEGPDDDEESVTLQNFGSAPASLRDWRLSDAAGRSWKLDGILAPGEQRLFKRGGRGMQLNNHGPETIALISAAGDSIHTVSYEDAASGEAIVFPIAE